MNSAGISLTPPKFFYWNLKTEFDRLRPFGIVADVSAYLASLPHRRKALVYIGESLDPLGPKNPLVEDDSDDRQRTGLRRAVTTARRANVAVYLLDPRRPLREGAEDLFDADRPRNLARLRAGDLSTLAELTGGSSSLNRAIVSQIDRIVTDASAYYLLGYRTDPAPAPGLAARLHRMASAWAGFRPIEVRTSRPGVRLRARRGYWPQAEAERAESTRPTSPRTDAASEALRGLVPSPALALAAFAAPFRGRDGTPVIAIAVEVQDAAFAAAAAGGLDETLAVSLVAAEPGEKVRAADRFTARMRLGSDKAVALAGGRYLVCATLPVSARRYQLRIGVQSAVAGTTGSVYQDVVVPDFRRRALSMSGVVLGLGTTHSPMPVARAQTLALADAVPADARALVHPGRPRADVRARVSTRAHDDGHAAPLGAPDRWRQSDLDGHAARDLHEGRRRRDCDGPAARVLAAGRVPPVGDARGPAGCGGRAAAGGLHGHRLRGVWLRSPARQSHRGGTRGICATHLRIGYSGAMNGTVSIEVDMHTAEVLETRAAELGMTVSQLIAELAVLDGAARQADADEVAELDRRSARAAEGSRVSHDRVVQWLRTWGTPGFRSWPGR